MLDLGWLPGGVDAQQVCDAAGGHNGCSEVQVKKSRICRWLHLIPYFYIHAYSDNAQTNKQKKSLHVTIDCFSCHQLGPLALGQIQIQSSFDTADLNNFIR